MFYRRDLMGPHSLGCRRSGESGQHCGREMGGSVEASQGHLEGDRGMGWFPELQADLGKREVRNFL